MNTRLLTVIAMLALALSGRAAQPVPPVQHTQFSTNVTGQVMTTPTTWSNAASHISIVANQLISTTNMVNGGLNARAFGAGDGITGDTVAIQAAITAASALKGGGGEVVIPGPYTYHMTGSLVIPDGIKLRGVGLGSTYTLRPEGGPMLIWDANPPLGVGVFMTNRSSHIEGILLNGNGVLNTGIEVDFENHMIRNMAVYGCTNIGIHYGDLINSEVIENCVVYENYNGFVSDGLQSTIYTIRDSKFMNNTNNGVFISAGSNVSLERNDIENNQGIGEWIERTAAPTRYFYHIHHRGNWYENNFLGGIRVISPPNIPIYNTSFEHDQFFGHGPSGIFEGTNLLSTNLLDNAYGLRFKNCYIADRFYLTTNTPNATFINCDTYATNLFYDQHWSYTGNTNYLGKTNALTAINEGSGNGNAWELYDINTGNVVSAFDYTMKNFVVGGDETVRGNLGVNTVPRYALDVIGQSGVNGWSLLQGTVGAGNKPTNLVHGVAFGWAYNNEEASIIFPALDINQGLSFYSQDPSSNLTQRMLLATNGTLSLAAGNTTINGVSGRITTGADMVTVGGLQTGGPLTTFGSPLSLNPGGVTTASNLVATVQLEGAFVRPLNMSPSTVPQTDGTTNLVSIANAAGFLYNPGAGGVYWTNVSSGGNTGVITGTVINNTAISGLLSVDSTKTNGIAATSAHVTNALGYAPVNKAGDTMTGTLVATRLEANSNDIRVTTNGFGLSLTDTNGSVVRVFDWEPDNTIKLGTGTDVLTMYGPLSLYGMPTNQPLIARSVGGRPILTNAPPAAYDVSLYGADGSGTTTTVSSWSDSTHVTVADASSFSIGQSIAIDRVGALETTGNTGADSTTISSVANTNGFAVNDYIRVASGQAAQAQVRTITVQVAGNAGDVVQTQVNGTNYTYTVLAGNTVNDVATGLAAAITGDAAVTASAAANVVSITANVAGTPFTYRNIRPWAQNPAENVRTKLTYQTTAANIPTTDVVVRITAAGATSFTVTPAIPSATTGTRIEKYLNRLVTTITGKVGSTLTLNNAATTLLTAGITVYHDSGAAFTSAIAAAGTGGTVFVPSGTFYISDLTTGVTFGSASLAGMGAQATVLKCPGWAVGAKLRWQIATNGAHNVTIRDFTFDASGNPYQLQAAGGIQLGTYLTTGANTNILASGVQVLNLSGAPMRFYNASNIRVERCHTRNTGDGTIFGAYDNGASATYTEMANIWAVGNLIEDCKNIGLMAYGDSSTGGNYTVGAFRGVHFNDNVFRHCALLGIEFYTGVYEGEAIGNTAEYCGGWESKWANGSANDHGGIAVKYCQNMVVANNVVRNSYRAYEVFGRTNDLTLGYRACRDVTIANNTALDCYQGVNASEGTDGLLVDGNQIDTCQDAGVNIGGRDTQNWPVTNVRVLNNTIRNTAYGMLLGPNTYNTEISGNVFDANNFFESPAAQRSGIALNFAGTGANPCTNIVIRNNQFTDTRVGPTNAQVYAVYANQATGITLIDNRAVGNKTNSYSLTANATLTQTVQNNWDLTRTWASISGMTPPTGTMDYASDVGIHLAYVNSRWKPLNGHAVLKTIPVAVTNIGNTETIVMQTQIPAGLWQSNDVVRINCDLTKSGAVDTLVASVRVGTAGTTGDAGVINVVTFLAASGRTWTGWLDLRLLSPTTTVLKVGGADASSTGVGSATGVASTVKTISSAASNALWVSLTIKSGGTTDTVGIDHGDIALVTQ